MKKSVSDYLTVHGLIDRIDAGVQARLLIREFPRGQPIIAMDEPLDGISLLVAGSIRVSLLMESGNPVVLSVERPLSVLGGMEVVNDWKALSRVEALSTAVCLSLPTADFHKYGERDPGLLSLILKDLSHKLLLTSRGSAMKNTAVLNRLSWYLLSEGESSVPYTRKSDIASFLGTSERHLNRELQLLERRGAVQTGGKEIRILDRRIIEEYFPDRI